MARSNILSDDVVRQLVAVGQVDILVGVPTFNHAATIQRVVQAVHTGLARRYPRERTVLINPDGGSEDGTPGLVCSARMADEELSGSTTLRTTHRVSAPYRGLPGHAAGERVVFAAADLLQARVVVVLDPGVTDPAPDSVAALVEPIWRDRVDFVFPFRPRRQLDGPLLSQLVHPLLGAAYGKHLYPSLTGEFACSGRFAARMVSHPMWQSDLARPACDVWLLATALAEEFRLGQLHLGPRTLAPHLPQVGLSVLFQQVVGALFACLDHHASSWLHRTGADDVPTIGSPWPWATERAQVEIEPMVERFRTGLRDLEPVLREILMTETLSGLRATAVAGERQVRISDSLWVATVYEFAAASRRGTMHREHLTQALVPLYLGRTASFFGEVAAADETALSERILMLEREYARMRPYLIERWNIASGR